MRFLVSPAFALMFITVAVETPYLADSAGVLAPFFNSVTSAFRFASVRTIRLRVTLAAAFFFAPVSLPEVFRCLDSSAEILVPFADYAFASFCASMYAPASASTTAVAAAVTFASRAVVESTPFGSLIFIFIVRFAIIIKVYKQSWFLVTSIYI